MGDLFFGDEKGTTLIEGDIKLKTVQNIPNSMDNATDKDYILNRYISEITQNSNGAPKQPSKIIDNIINIGPVKKLCKDDLVSKEDESMEYGIKPTKDYNQSEINRRSGVSTVTSGNEFSVADLPEINDGGHLNLFSRSSILSFLKNKIILILLITAIFLIKSLPLAIIIPVYFIVMGLMAVRISYDKPFVLKGRPKNKGKEKSKVHINRVNQRSNNKGAIKVVESRIGITTQITLPMRIYNLLVRPEIDSGAAVNCISIDLAKKLCSDIDSLRDTTEYHLFDVNNNPIQVVAAKLLRAHIDGYGDIYVPVHIINSENIFLLGRQFLLKHQLMLEIRGRRVIISLRSGFIKNPRLVNIDKVHINPGEQIESAFKPHDLLHNSIFDLYGVNNKDIQLEYKVYRNNNGHSVTVAIRNTGSVPLHLKSGELIFSAIPIALPKNQFTRPNILEELNKDEAFINFCSNQSVSRTIIRSREKEKDIQKINEDFINLYERMIIIKNQITDGLSENWVLFSKEFPNVNVFLSKSLLNMRDTFESIIAIFLNNINWLADFRKNFIYQCNKMALIFNFSIINVKDKINHSFGKKYSFDKIMIKKISGESNSDFIKLKEDDEVTISQLKDRMTEGQEGISIEAPLPYPKLTLEQISENLNYISDLNIRTKVAKILFNYDNAASHTYDVGGSINKLDFPLPDKIPHNTKVYNLNMVDTMHLFHFIKLCEEQKILEPAPSDLQFGCPVFMTSRKNPQESPRIVIDARAINDNVNYNTASITLDPLQTLQNLLPHVRYGSFVDVKNAFYSLQLSDSVINSGITNIVTSFGVFRFRRALTGYAGTPALLLSYILSNIHLNEDNILDVIDLLIIFFDDLSLFSYLSENIDDHLSKLEKFLKRMNRLNLKLNLSKCRFCVDLTMETIQVLGYEIGKGQIKIPNKKIEYIQKIESPKNLKDLQSLLGNLTYFRALMPLNIHRNMNELYGQVRNFNWDEEAEKRFLAIKTFLKQENCTLDQNYGHDVQFLYCDASERALGGALIGLRVADLLPQVYPPTSKITDPIFINYFEKNDNIEILFKNKNYMHLFFEISNFLRVDKHSSFEEWYKKFMILSMSNIELKQVLNLQDAHNENILSQQEIIQKYNQFCNSLFSNKVNLDSPDIFTYFVRTFSAYTKRKINLIYLKAKSEEVINTSVIYHAPHSQASEINIIWSENTYQYLVVKNTVEINNHKYNKTCCNVDLLDRDLFVLVERALRMDPNKMKGRVTILGYFSKAVAQSVMKTSAIVYLELLAIFESLTYFDTQIKNTKTLVLTDNATAVKILNNKKIEAKKSKLDILSQRVLFWYGNSISFLTVTTKEQIADFISRLLPGKEENLNFGDPLKPLYEGSLFEIFQPIPLKRSKETFIKNMLAIKRERINYVQRLKINAVTRGKTDAIMEAWDQINPKKRKSKNKDKLKKDNSLHNSIDHPSRNLNLSAKTEDTKIIKADDNKIDMSTPANLTISDPLPNHNYQPNVEVSSLNNLITKENSVKDNHSNEKLDGIDDNDILDYQAPSNGPIMFNNFVLDNIEKSKSDISLFHSENRSGLDKNIGHIDKELNRKRSDKEFDEMKGKIVETFLDELDNQEIIPSKPNNIAKSQSSKTKLKTSRNPFLPNTIETEKIFDKYVFIQMQIREAIVEDINPLTLKYCQNKLILPQILYSLVAVIMHGGLVHCGTERLYNNINQ
ncbi:MAG: hypothetical protein GY739_00215, partial [Mesoflavibacter sp.]|nr:hypothetical protein [Mesoflavibacter sp.]